MLRLKLGDADGEILGEILALGDILGDMEVLGLVEGLILRDIL